jgi:hypothetical protein
MFRTQTNNLSADQRHRLHADFLANEQDYLAMRDSLLQQYRGQWVAVHNGRVIAANPNVLVVTEAAAATSGHPYVALVGEEDRVQFRVRRMTFAYDQSYQPSEIDGNRYPALIQPVAGGQERIVGRDVLNQLRVLFDGPGARVVIDP